MDDRYDDPRMPADLERIRSSVGGGAFPHPPVLPIVAVLTLLLGLSIGFSLAPKEGAGSTPSSTLASETPHVATAAPTATATSPKWGVPPIVYITPAPVVTTTPPPGGVTVTDALITAEDVYGFDESEVLDVRLVDNSQYYNDPARADLWVWEIVVKGPGPVACESTRLHGLEPSAVPTVLTFQTSRLCQDDTDVVVVDYLTGKVLALTATTYP